MSSHGSNNYPRCEDSATSSLPSISTLYTTKLKTPYTPWYVVSGNPPRTPATRYGPQNDTYFTLQVSHGGTLVDRPGKPYRKSTVTFFEAVNVKRLDLDELCLISRHLGYPTMGKWYYMDEGPDASLELVPLRTEVQLASFRERVQSNNFKDVQKVFVEHGDASEFLFLPKDLMQCGKKRLEKVVALLLLSNPGATVKDGVDYVHWMTGIRVPMEKMKRAFNQASETLGIWR